MALGLLGVCCSAERQFDEAPGGGSAGQAGASGTAGGSGVGSTGGGGTAGVAGFGAGAGTAGTAGSTSAGGFGGSQPSNTCGGTTPLDDEPGAPCGICDSGVVMCDGPDATACIGEKLISTPIGHEGTVSASTVFNGFPPAFAIDGDDTTSWFSTGPEGQPTQFEWRAPTTECFTSITIVSNDNNANPDFREEYGFGQVTVQILDDSDMPVWSETRNLTGTPDPTTTVEPAGVRGEAIRLLLTGHESPDCGGFSELRVVANR